VTVLYQCQTWVSCPKECTQIEGDGRIVLPRISGPMSKEVTGEWEKLHSEELRDFCSSPNILRVVKLDGKGMLHTLKG
jgi:hypothetical protein